MLIPFHKVKIKAELFELLEIKEILDSGQVVNGPWTEKLEQHFIDMTGVKYAIACASCTAGLLAAVDNIGCGTKKIALPSFTWPSTDFAVRHNRAWPIYCDIDKDTWIIKPPSARGVDAMIVVDTFGNQADIDFPKPIIYDAAHGYGLPKLGKRGLVEVVSLAMTKAVTGMQGGVILTDHKGLARNLRKHIRTFAKITEINAYLALESARDYDKELERRQSAVERYRDFLSIPYKVQYVPEKTNLSVFAILLEDRAKRDRIADAFRKLEIEVKIYYEPVTAGLKNTNDVYSRIIALPTWDGIEDQIPSICRVINNA